MQWNDRRFSETVDAAASHLMEGFLAWNDEQERLAQAGEDNSFHGDEDMIVMRSAFRAVAERFVLEDVDARDWEWLTTSWAGIDGNTGHGAYILDFTPKGGDAPDWGVLSFYATSNTWFWFAIPLAEKQSPKIDLATCEANSVRQAIECMSKANG